MADELDTLPIVNAIAGLRESNADNTRALQSTLRNGLLGVVKSVDRINAAILNSFSNIKRDPFEGTEEMMQSMERGAISTGAELAQIIQPFLQFSTSRNTAQQAEFSEQVEKQTEAMVVASKGQIEMFAGMGRILGNMNDKLADIAAHTLRQLQYQKLQLSEKRFPGLIGDEHYAELSDHMAKSIGITLERWGGREDRVTTDVVLQNLENTVQEVYQSLGIQSDQVSQAAQQGAEVTAENTQAVNEGNDLTNKNNKLIKKQIEDKRATDGWLIKLHQVIKKDLVDNLKQMVSQFKGGMLGGAMTGGVLGYMLGGPLGAGLGAMAGSGVGGLFAMIASRAALGVLANPYVLAAATAATAGYLGLEKFKEDIKERLEFFPEESQLEAGTRVLGDYTATGLGKGLGVPLDFLNDKLFGVQSPIFEKAITDATHAAFDKVADNVRALEEWIKAQNFRNPFTESPDGTNRGWLGNYWENLKKDLNTIESAIKDWVLEELEGTREGLKQLWNDSWGPDITGLYFRKSEAQLKKERLAKGWKQDESDVPKLPTDLLPVPNKNPAPLINQQSRDQILSLARSQSSPVLAPSAPNMINQMFDNSSRKVYNADISAGKYSPSIAPDPFSSLYGNFGK